MQTDSPTFAELLRHYRHHADLTQEELAERAGLSVRAIGTLERGEKHAPRKETVQLLADALGLSQENRAQLEASVRRKHSPLGIDERREAAQTLKPTAPPAELRTFLMADMRGYTHFTQERGDEAAAAIAEKFAALAGQVVEDHAGCLLDLPGDGALAAFSSARQALRAALTLQLRAAADEGEPRLLPVGIGLDAGEAIPVQGGYRGAALNLACRLSDVARPGEVLASETVVNLARKTEGLAYAERGPVSLKGLDHPVAVKQVVPASPRQETGASAGAEERERPATGPLPVGGFLGAVPAHPLVARSDELNEILRAVDAVAKGNGRLVLISGEPGIGKTRLAQEVSGVLRQRDFLVAQGRCYESQQAIPFYPFLEALATVYAAAPAAIQAGAGLRWPYLASLLPDYLDTSSFVPSGRPEEQHRLFRAVTSFLGAIAAVQPVALLMDDLHWADTTSLELLQHLARHTRALRILLLGTYCDDDVRRDHLLRRVVRDLHREGLIERVPLQPLGCEDTADLVQSTLGEVCDPDGLARLVYQHTEGNPFFALEVVRTLLERGDVFQEDERSWIRPVEEIAVPATVRDAILERVFRLGKDKHDILHEASVFGQTFGFDELRAVGNRAEGAIEEALVDAGAAGLIRFLDKDRYTFNHALTQQALYANLSPRARKRLHLAAAEVLQTTSTHRAAEIAWHFLQGGSPSQALPYALAAGDDAEEVFAHADAEKHYRTAWTLAQDLMQSRVPAQEKASQTLEAEAAEKLGVVLGKLARYDEALAVLEKAAELNQMRHDAEGHARVAAHIGLLHANRGTRQEAIEAIERLEHLLESLQDAEPSRGLALIYVALAHLHFDCGHYRKELAAASKAVEIARATGDERIMAAAEARRGRAMRNLGRYREALGVLDAVIPVAERMNDLDSLCLALSDAGALCQGRGELVRARQLFERALAVAERLNDQVHIAHALANCAMNAFLTGDWQRSRLWVERAATLISRVGTSWITGYCLVGPGVFRWLDGEGEPASVYLQHCISIAAQSNDLTGLSIAQWFLAEGDLLEGRPERVIARIESLLDLKMLQEADITILLPMLAAAHLQLGDTGSAEALLTKAVTWMEAQGDHLWLVDALHVRGAVAARKSRLEEAARIFDHAVALAETMPCPFFQARTQFEYGTILVRGGRLSEAERRLREALGIFERLGAQPYILRTEQTLATLME